MAKSKGMTPERWRELKGVKPRFRWARTARGDERTAPPSARREPKTSSSARMGHGHHRGERPLIRSTSGHSTFRGVDSTWQQREPSHDAAVIHLTQSPPWVRKRKARRKTQLAKVSRRVNRG